MLRNQRNPTFDHAMMESLKNLWKVIQVTSFHLRIQSAPVDKIKSIFQVLHCPAITAVNAQPLPDAEEVVDYKFASEKANLYNSASRSDWISPSVIGYQSNGASLLSSLTQLLRGSECFFDPDKINDNVHHQAALLYKLDRTLADRNDVFFGDTEFDGFSEDFLPLVHDDYSRANRKYDLQCIET
jgi:hypothetical protein